VIVGLEATTGAATMITQVRTTIGKIYLFIGDLPL
jgi:hypothetical protein